MLIASLRSLTPYLVAHCLGVGLRSVRRLRLRIWFAHRFASLAHALPRSPLPRRRPSFGSAVAVVNRVCSSLRFARARLTSQPIASASAFGRFGGCGCDLVC